MGCDIDYVLDNELWNLSSQEFLKEFEKRIGEKIYFVDEENEMWDYLKSCDEQNISPKDIKRKDSAKYGKSIKCFFRKKFRKKIF